MAQVVSSLPAVWESLPAVWESLPAVGSIPGTGRSPGEGNGDPLQYSCLENPMERGAKRRTGLSVSMLQVALHGLGLSIYIPLGLESQPGEGKTWSLKT